jgi:hypothetical protein
VTCQARQTAMARRHRCDSNRLVLLSISNSIQIFRRAGVARSHWHAGISLLNFSLGSDFFLGQTRSLRSALKPGGKRFLPWNQGRLRCARSPGCLRSRSFTTCRIRPPFAWTGLRLVPGLGLHLIPGLVTLSQPKMNCQWIPHNNPLRGVGRHPGAHRQAPARIPLDKVSDPIQAFCPKVTHPGQDRTSA